MFRDEFLIGGPVMYVIFGVWVLVTALVLERLLFWARRVFSRNPVAIGDAAEELAQRVTAGAEQNLDRIDGLSHLATSLGLFGTVLGIIKAFMDLSQDIAGGAAVVMSGISEALVATALGLFVAIPSVIAYNTLKVKVRAMVTSAEYLAQIVIAHGEDSHGERME